MKKETAIQRKRRLDKEKNKRDEKQQQSDEKHTRPIGECGVSDHIFKRQAARI